MLHLLGHKELLKFIVYLIIELLPDSVILQPDMPLLIPPFLIIQLISVLGKLLIHIKHLTACVGGREEGGCCVLFLSEKFRRVSLVHCIAIVHLHCFELT